MAIAVDMRTLLTLTHMQVWSSVPWWARQSVKLLQLDRASYGPYLAALPDTVDLPMLWSDNDIARLQSPYIIDKVCVCIRM